MEPPADLNEQQAGIWREIVERMPQDWFSADNAPLLAELCRHVSYARRLAVQIAAVEPRMAEDKVARLEFCDLLKAHGFQSRQIGNLATKLRLSNQSRYDPTMADIGRKGGRPTAVAKPWTDWGAQRANGDDENAAD
jgi:hypothetical protein